MFFHFWIAFDWQNFLRFFRFSQIRMLSCEIRYRHIIFQMITDFWTPLGFYMEILKTIFKGIYFRWCDRQQINCMWRNKYWFNFVWFMLYLEPRQWMEIFKVWSIKNRTGKKHTLNKRICNFHPIRLILYQNYLFMS